MIKFRAKPVLRLHKERIILIAGFYDKKPQVFLVEKTGRSAAFISDIWNDKQSVPDDFKFDLAKLIGADPNKPEEVVKLLKVEWEDDPVVPNNHPLNNLKKERGEMRQSSWNPTNERRLRDKASAGDRLATADPIPAIDYYGSLLPKRCVARYRYKR
ncbi:MAG: hypothetical protein WC569_02300 [Candidatus Omnitrophota bacterium]